MAAVLSSRLVKHYSAPCRRPPPPPPPPLYFSSFLLSPLLLRFVRILVLPSRSSSFVCTACLAPQYPTRGHQSAPTTDLRSLYRREQGRSTELQRNDEKADANLVDLLGVFIRSRKTTAPLLFLVLARVKGNDLATMEPCILNTKKKEKKDGDSFCFGCSELGAQCCLKTCIPSVGVSRIVSESVGNIREI